jgi:hypothetical protein
MVADKLNHNNSGFELSDGYKQFEFMLHAMTSEQIKNSCELFMVAL